MIVEWLIGLGVGFLTTVMGWWPALEIPAEITNVDDQVNAIFDMGDGLGVWADWGLVTLILSVPPVVYAAGLTVRAVRAAVAHVPFFGGRG